MRWFHIFVILFLISCAHNPVQKIEDRKISSQNTVNLRYSEIFSKVRETLKLQTQVTRRSKKSPPESLLINALQNDPGLLLVSNAELLKEIENESEIAADLTKHLRLVPPKGQWGYSDLNIYANHPYFKNKEIVVPSNLVEVWKNFIASAEKQIILNIFDFDLKIIADQLIAKSQSGVQVFVGIDKKTTVERPEVKAVYEALIAGGVQVTLVNSVSLNHQKMAAIDWENSDKAKVLFSSGNLTQSCLGPEGDLVNISLKKRPKESIPNANHVLTMRSWVLANLVQHELTKTLDSKFLYRGAQYPTTGSFQVTGPGVDPQTLEAYPENSMVITFSPGGAFRNINKNIIAHFIKTSSGPIRMVQFAYSSGEVSKALLERAQKDFQEKNNFDFKSIGDTPFALQFWSQFLKMSGLDVVKDENMKKTFQELPTNQWNKALSKDQIKKLRERVRIAPEVYGTRKIKIDEKFYHITAKIHHKIMSAGPYAIVGTSFNFSEGAESNNEQILVFKDKNLVQFVDGITEWLGLESRASVYQEAMRRMDSFRD